MSDKRIHDPIHEKETENTVSNRGGVMHQNVKTEPLNKRSPKTTMIRPRSYQKEH